MNSSILLKLIKFGIGFILFIPLYIGGSFYFPFIFPKIWLFQLIVEIIFFLYIILALRDARFRPKWNWVIGALALLSLVLIITSFTGVDAFRSFWGNTERMSGVIAWSHFAVFAVILSSILTTEKEWRKFFGIAVIVSIFEFIYTLAQYFSASWAWLPLSQSGTIGNADLLGTYAIFSAFFSLHLWRNGKPNSKYFWAAAFFLNIGTLYIASSRGAIIGFVAGIVAYMLFDVAGRRDLWKRWAIIAAVSLLIYGFLWAARGSDLVKNNVQLTRLTNISLEGDTIQQRFTEWGIAWNAFKARPIFGFGTNNYLYLHNAFLNSRVYELRETNFDRAHNAYLDYASMSGIFGLSGYVFLIGILFWIFFRTKLWTLASLMVAYAVQSFFVFDSPASYIAFFLTIGFAIYARNIQHEMRNIEKTYTGNFSSQVNTLFYVLCFMFTAYVFWQVSVVPAAANIKFANAFNNPSIDAGTSFNLYKQALVQETLGTTEFRNQYNSWLQKNMGNFKPEERIAVLDFGINELEKEVKDHPMVFSYLNLGQLYHYKARGFQNEPMKRAFFAKAAGAYDKALELSPNRLEVYYSYLQMSFDEKKYNQGTALMQRAVSYAPNYWQTNWYLGFAYIAAGEDKKAAGAINKALAIIYNLGGVVMMDNDRLTYDYNKILNYISGFAPNQEILGAVNPYIRLKMWPELLLLYLSAEEGDPGDIQLHQSLALVYQNLGMTDKADAELKVVETLQKKQ